MGEHPDRRTWFAFSHPGRRHFTSWRGPVAFGALMLVVVVGGWVEDALRPEHPVIALVVMTPLALVALGLAALIVMRTE